MIPVPAEDSGRGYDSPLSFRKTSDQEQGENETKKDSKLQCIRITMKVLTIGVSLAVGALVVFGGYFLFRSKSDKETLSPKAPSNTEGKKIHRKARGPHPAYKEHPRTHVADSQVPWATPWPSYAPTKFTHKTVLAKPVWADPADPRDPKCKRNKSFEGPIDHDPSTGRPLNPRGRTGMCERGLLGFWGPNHIADPIVTRYDPKTGQLQMVAIERKDTKDCAIPEGMVVKGEKVTVTIKREFREAGKIQNAEDRALFQKLTDKLFKDDGKVVYEGYVDDPRNTDNAWMETSTYHFHCPDGLGAKLPLNAVDDASKSKVTWLNIDVNEPRYRDLYATHKAMVDKAVSKMSKRRQLSPTNPLAERLQRMKRW